MFLDCLVLKIREGGSVQRRACYLALGVTVDGDRDVLGMWFQETEGAKFWMQVLSELKHRGVRDILVCCVDGLKGFPEAIEAIFPFPNEDAARKLIYLALLNAVPQWTKTRNWTTALLIAVGTGLRLGTRPAPRADPSVHC